jgi:protein KTI12
MQIKESLEHHLKDASYQGPLKRIAVLSDDFLNLDRAVYDGRFPCARPLVNSPCRSVLDSQSEKAARGALFTAMRRQLALDTVLIVDAMNYIKGFRYQMYCAAREMKLRLCTVRYSFLHIVTIIPKPTAQVYVIANHELCRERNSTRSDGHRYSSETYVISLFSGLQLTSWESLENLLVRYEEPSSMVRWDSPLISILWTEEYSPVHQIWDSVSKGNVKPPNSGTLAVCTRVYVYGHSDN